MEYCVYYDKKTGKIIEFLPQDIDFEIKSKISEYWNQPIARKILMLLSSEGKLTAPRIKEKIGHSMSTLHEVTNKLENEGLIQSEMVYKDKKQKILSPRVFFVTKNPKLASMLKRFLSQGLWIDSEKMKIILDFLKKSKGKYFTVEEISVKTKIPADEIKGLLDNWDSQITRGVSGFLKAPPFEKKVMYRVKK